MPTADTPLSGLVNIGSTIAARLAAVGIRTAGDFQRATPAGAYTLVWANNPGKTIPVCYYLYSLQGALDGLHWNDLPEKNQASAIAARQMSIAPDGSFKPMPFRGVARFGRWAATARPPFFASTP